MAKYLLLEHYRRGGPAWLPGTDVPMDQWAPEEIEAHIAFMNRVADDLRERDEVDAALPRRDAVAACLHERAGDVGAAARLNARGRRPAVS